MRVDRGETGDTHVPFRLSANPVLDSASSSGIRDSNPRLSAWEDEKEALRPVSDRYVTSGRTLKSLPPNIQAITAELYKARRIVFYTSVDMQGLTAAEMAAIQADPALRAKTIFVYGGF